MSLFSFGLGATGTGGGGGETIYLYPEHFVSHIEEDCTIQFDESDYIISYDDAYDIDVVFYDDEDEASVSSGDTITHVT